MKPNCAAEVSVPSDAAGQPKSRCRSGITALTANQGEVPRSGARTRTGRTQRGVGGDCIGGNGTPCKRRAADDLGAACLWPLVAMRATNGGCFNFTGPTCCANAGSGVRAEVQSGQIRPQAVARHRWPEVGTRLGVDVEGRRTKRRSRPRISRLPVRAYRRKAAGRVASNAFALALFLGLPGPPCVSIGGRAVASRDRRCPVRVWLRV